MAVRSTVTEPASSDTMQRGAEVFKALGHPSRLAMVAALEKGEQCVCDLHGLVGGDLSTVSNHLAVLRAAGLVKSERRGTQVFYRLRLRCVLTVVHCVERFEEC